MKNSKNFKTKILTAAGIAVMAGGMAFSFNARVNSNRKTDVSLSGIEGMARAEYYWCVDVSLQKAGI